MAKNNVYICEKQNKIISDQCQISFAHEKITCHICLNYDVIYHYKINFDNVVPVVPQIICFDCIKKLHSNCVREKKQISLGHLFDYSLDPFFCEDDFNKKFHAWYIWRFCHICSLCTAVYYFVYKYHTPTQIPMFSPRVCIKCLLKISDYEMQKTVKTVTGSKNTIRIKKRMFVPKKWSILNHQFYPQPKFGQISEIIIYLLLLLKKLRSKNIRIDKHILFEIFRLVF